VKIDLQPSSSPIEQENITYKNSKFEGFGNHGDPIRECHASNLKENLSLERAVTTSTLTSFPLFPNLSTSEVWKVSLFCSGGEELGKFLDK